jgi:hypothetical protein
MPPLIGLTMTATTNMSTMGIVPTTTTCASATANNGGHVDHAIWACDETCHHNHTCHAFFSFTVQYDQGLDCHLLILTITNTMMKHDVAGIA